MTTGLINAWYRFPEVKQIWFGFTLTGNNGSGLGRKFAIALHENLSRIFGNFGAEEITKSSHLEKLCLIRDGVGRDNISDFTTNLIREFLLAYTQTFARKHVSPSLCKNVTVNKVRFNYTTETWERGQYYLPWREKDYVLLTPRDTLTKENTWINRTDLIDDFHYIPDAIPNDQLRTQINNYFVKILPRKSSRKEERDAAMRTIMNFPQLIDYYILRKEQNGDKAFDLSTALVSRSKRLYVDQFKELIRLLREANFYEIVGNTYDEAHQRIAYFKDVIENKGGHRLLYEGSEPIGREYDLQIMFKLTWFGTPSDVSSEVNDGRGSADFKFSRGRFDKTLVEFKLASNTRLKRNLARQNAIYEKASDAKKSIRVIIYYSKSEFRRVTSILEILRIEHSPDVVLIDARRNNKPPGSKA